MDFPGENTSSLFHGAAATAIEAAIERAAFSIWKSRIKVCSQITTSVDDDKQAIGFTLETENDERYFGMIAIKTKEGTVVAVYKRTEHQAFQALDYELQQAFNQIFTDCEVASACMTEDDVKIVEKTLK